MKIFEVLTEDSHTAARTALLHTPHGIVKTPVFMPIATRGAVKGITPRQLKQNGTQMLLANTYHLLLRPGAEIIQSIGGLHKLMDWNGPVLTDSGGYQVFSLSTLNTVCDDGVEFASHIDGARIFLDPKIVTDIQNRLGADIIMCFDQCTAHPCPQKELQNAVQRTVKWAKICKDNHQNSRQLLFAIVQGGIDPSLRADCAKQLTQMDLPGYAIGGLSVGEGHHEMIRTVEYTAPLLPTTKPRHLMGVGTPADIIAAVRAGIDMFDCVLPTRNGRNAFAFTEKGPVRLRNNVHSHDTAPIEQKCTCYCCKHFSRASIRHFFNVGEMLGPILVSMHNLHFYHRLMKNIRQAIKNGNFELWAQQQIVKYQNLHY
ncbi:MAG: tRNA guanosine(34) transglycosylase Tgt [Planctomycetota bacterium]